MWRGSIGACKVAASPGSLVQSVEDPYWHESEMIGEDVEYDNTMDALDRAELALKMAKKKQRQEAATSKAKESRQPAANSKARESRQPAKVATKVANSNRGTSAASVAAEPGPSQLPPLQPGSRKRRTIGSDSSDGD